MSDYWFKPKSHGYGAAPSNWKGWLATLFFVLLSTAVTGLFIVWPAVARVGPTVWHFVVWLAVTAILTAGFVGVCKAKTDGEWKWRWGE